jgi:hypothetical protein
MRAIFTKLSCCFFIAALLYGCKQQKEDFKTDPLTDYLPLQPGKFITYRLDSTIYTQNGSVQEIHSYQEKTVVDKEITYNLGRTAYRVYRFTRDVAGQNPWIASGTYYVTPTKGEIEVTEDNFRIVRLVLPISEGQTWKGNRFLATAPYSTRYEFSDDSHIYLEDWDFTFSKKGETITLNGKTINDVITIQGPDESVNATISDPKSFGSRTYSIEKYAKNIGLVYQELMLWEYQPNPGSSPFKLGFSIKRSMTDHN